MRTRRARRAASLVAVVVWLLTTLTTTVNAFTLTSGQTAERDFGRFDQLADFSAVAAVQVGTHTAVDAVVGVARAGGIEDALPLLTSFDVTVGSSTTRTVAYLESAWATGPFPDRYHLLSGRWPTDPREAVVTASLRGAIRAGRIDVFSGNEQLDVVGTVEDRFATGSSRILAAPGTWASWSDDALRQRFPDLTCALAVFSHRDLDAFAVSAARALVGTGDTETPPGGAVPAATVRSRAETLATPRASAVDQYPLILEIPALVLPLIAVAILVAATRATGLRTVVALRSVGVPVRTAVLAYTLAGTALVVAQWALGAVLGLLSGLAGRAVATRLSTQPLSPWSNPMPLGAAVLAVMVLALAVAGCAAVIAGRSTGRGGTSARLPDRRRLEPHTIGRVRLGLAAVGLVVAVVLLVQVGGTTDAMTFTGVYAAAMLLLVPSVVTALIRVTPERGPRARLWLRQMANDGQRIGATVAALAGVLGLLGAFVVLLQTLVTSDEAAQVPGAPPHQLVVTDPSGPFAPPDPAVVDAVRAAGPITAPPVATAYACAPDGTCVYVRDGGPGTVLLLHTIDDIETISGTTLDSSQRTVLENGGMLFWDGNPTARTLALPDDDGNGSRTLAMVPVGNLSFPVSYRQSAEGVMLVASAQRIGAPVTDGPLVFTGLDDVVIRRAVEGVAAAGLNPRTVKAYVEPDSDVPPVLYVSVVVLAALTVATVYLVIRTQALTLRGYLASLMSVGVPARWTRQVLGLHASAIVGATLAAAAVISVPPIALSAAVLGQLQFDVPWLWLSGLTGLFVAAAAVALAVAGRRLRVDERTLL